MGERELNHRVPEFYCCYLLRSVQKKQSFYIGSTPNPVRRLRQHNGILTNGSAYRTKKTGLRPWEMIFCVYGFTSKIAALQFEHAWQHSYHTHFIDDEERIVKNKTSGRSLHHKLGNVRLLLKNPFFQYMDLLTHVFDEEAFRVWNQNRFKLSSCAEMTVSDFDDVADASSLQVSENPGNSENSDDPSLANLKFVEKLFADILAQHRKNIERQQKFLSHGKLVCGVCHNFFNYMDENDSERRSKPLVAFCPAENCNFVSHLNCLHRVFLDDEQLDRGARTLIPKSGNCPFCEKVVSWPVIVKYSTCIRDCNELGKAAKDL
ncbi:LAME_0C07338g1_1 [Lachancea meyersii CBS 8951]|uniref:LAME_0C07338g1_1 n=1 Tax=Lachancea meyersii CBS 8951 TaxID=1266667 RepID=A0A1G4J2P2_9SACH|nr:LAME_0C07338g1_1 [Lachancea meyersii CBS 8951]